MVIYEIYFFKVPKIKPAIPIKSENKLMIVLMLLYFSIIIVPVFAESIVFLYIYTAIYYIGVFVLSEIIVLNERKKSYRCFKKRIKKYVKFLIFETFFLVLATGIITLSSGILLGRISNNESDIRKLPPVIQLIGTVIYAPIAEETIFRYVMRRFIKYDQLFILTSGLVFGVLHTVSSFNDFRFTEWTVLSTPYILIGLFLGYVYACTNSIEITIINHRTLNIVASLPLIISFMK